MKEDYNHNRLNFTEEPLFLFYLKREVLSIRFMICILFSLIPLMLLMLAWGDWIPSSQNGINSIFWFDFVSYTIVYSPFFTLISVFITADIVSGEFSNKSAMILYTLGSRSKILIIKFLYLMLSIFIFTVICFISFSIYSFFRCEKLASVDFFLAGFIIAYFDLLFFVSLTFLCSTLIRKTSPVFILPMLYMFLDFYYFFEMFELDLLSYRYYLLNVFEFFSDILYSNAIIITAEMIINLILAFGLPLLLFIITIYAFTKIDIRVD